ncbi:MAG: C25 family cysteine peptidase, partial [bacterium]
RYTTHVVNVADLYDVFHNGSTDPEAIKAFATYAYHRWSDPLAFLCLVGDASEDHRRVTANSDPDFVPSQSLYTTYAGQAEESDQYFAEVTRASGTTWDDLSDIYLGRLAVGTPEELDWNVRRIREYETGVGDETWRRRILLLADDQFSGDLGAGVGDGYGWRGEAGFEDVSETIAASLAAHPFDKIITEKLYGSRWSHPCPDSCYSPFPPPNCEAGGLECGLWYDCRNDADWVAEYTCMKTNVREAVNPEIRRILRDGVLMWNFQGHANKYWLSHEEVFQDWERLRVEDVSALSNFGRPFLFLGFACHLAEFDRDSERVEGDCISEKLMNRPADATEPPGGAVGVFASSGFEFLGENLVFNEVLMDAFFYPERWDPIRDGGLPNGPTVDGVYHWTLGESTLRARLMYQDVYPTPNSRRQAAQRFILLGDPALEPNLGGPEFAVTVNGEVVHDGEFLGLGGVTSTMRVEAFAKDGRGIVSMRVVDSQLGEIPPTAFEVAVVDTSEHGVTQSRRLTYEAPVRAEDYDVVLEAVDGQGAVSKFTMLLRNAVEIREALAYPNPFANETNLYFVLTTAAPDTKVTVYTLNGRRIWETTVAAEADRNQVAWDGRDSDGTLVANGSYLVRIRASGANAVDATFPVVKMR